MKETMSEEYFIQATPIGYHIRVLLDDLGVDKDLQKSITGLMYTAYILGKNDCYDDIRTALVDIHIEQPQYISVFQRLADRWEESKKNRDK